MLLSKDGKETVLVKSSFEHFLFQAAPFPYMKVLQ